MQNLTRLNQSDYIRASNDAGSGESQLARALQQFLDASFDQQVRVIHLEQESTGCRIRQRAHGVLTEQRLDDTTFASDFRDYLQRTLPSPAALPGGLTATLSHRHIDCHLTCHWYPTTQGQVVILKIFHERNIPESLEQTTLDQSCVEQLRQQIKTHSGGLMVICSESEELLCDTYYALLAELTDLENKVISFESAARKHIARINQVQAANDAVMIPDDSSHVFIDWQSVKQQGVLNSLLADYRTAVVFVQSQHLPAAIRQLTDIAFNERQLASNLESMLELAQVRLVCPHCAAAHHPNGSEISQLTSQGIDADSTLNYAPGCSTCDYTGYGEAKSLMAFYPVTDKLRASVETRRNEAVQQVLTASKVISVNDQRRLLISCGQVEFKLSASG